MVRKYCNLFINYLPPDLFIYLLSDNDWSAKDNACDSGKYKSEIIIYLEVMGDSSQSTHEK